MAALQSFDALLMVWGNDRRLHGVNDEAVPQVDLQMHQRRIELSHAVLQPLQAQKKCWVFGKLLQSLSQGCAVACRVMQAADSILK